MIQESSIMWLSKKVLDWNAVIFQVASTDPKDFFRAYELFQHAESLIINNTNDLQLADGISNLKRALNQRLKCIDELYSVSAAFPGNFGFLECLRELDLARPFVIKQLLEIRNNIEHNDSAPPTHTRCLELLDVTWYLLKSTDSICASRRESIDLEYGQKGSFGTEYVISIYPQQNKPCEIKFHGRFPSAAISGKELPGFFPFDSEKIHTKNGMMNLIETIRNDDMRALRKFAVQAWHHDDLSVNGRTILQPHLFKLVLKKLLATTPKYS